MPEIADNAKQMKAIFLPGKLARCNFFIFIFGRSNDNRVFVNTPAKEKKIKWTYQS